MALGMLWYEPDKKKPIEKTLQEAIAYYKEKYGKDATTIHMNPADFKDHPSLKSFLDAKIETSRHVLPRHYFIG